ncbi:MAG: hypothetical protein GY913_27635 [Proteobacteria bacterium]|nr:hypothetical protein [Pseudomonadota bacterium]MCP4920688.1 hypothetical protein [Pseudomonadota bacterium]
MDRRLAATCLTMFLVSFALVLFELLLTRLFGVVLFAQFAHLALALALLGIGVGSVAQHLWPELMPEDGLHRRLGQLALLQAVLTVVAVVAVLYLPVITQFETPPESYQERSSIKDDLLDPFWFAVLLPILALPFTAAGLAFSGVFQRLRKQIGVLYGADLVGGAVGAVVFLPLLGTMAGPDTVFPIILALAGAAVVLFWVVDDRKWLVVSGLVFGLSGAAMFAGMTDIEVLKVRNAAGYAEESVVHTRWTPLVRLSVYEAKRAELVLLDNSSASEIAKTDERIAELALEPNRALVYRFQEAGGRVAILAASAGPEVAVAQATGHYDIDAIDVAGDIFDLVRERYPNNPVIPYNDPRVNTINSDGRAAILHAEEPYAIIHMVHANLWSSAGLLSNAWSPSLLETVEAFETYLDKLEPDGTLAFGRGSQTPPLVRSAAQALRNMGMKRPRDHIAYVTGGATFMLVKKRAWTEDEVSHFRRLVAEYPKTHLVWDPGMDAEPPPNLFRGRVMTDDRPYLDDPGMVLRHLDRAMERATGADEEPLTALYRSVVIQCTFVLIAGLLFVFLPMIRRGPTELRGVRFVGLGLLYVCALGYGYLAVETVLIHELVLFVGHPTYAVTIVILAMLASSGAGSVLAGRVPQPKLLFALRVVLATVLALGAFHVFVTPGLLYGTALGLPLVARLALVGAALVPLGLVMGMPFPLAMRLLPDEAGGIVPWAWALNGWMSVVAGLATVLLSRMQGYTTAFAVALSAYVIALLLSGVLPKMLRR